MGQRLKTPAYMSALPIFMDAIARMRPPPLPARATLIGKPVTVGGCREKRTIRFSTRNSGAAVPVPKIPMIRRPEQDSACSTEAMGQLQIIAQWVARILHGTGFQFAFYHHPV
jgi:hypothetical protein